MFSRHPWLPIITIPLGVVGGFLLSAIVTYMMPKKYESEAVVQVVASNASQTGESGLEQRMMATTSNIFTSHEVLSRVIKALELTQRWNLDPDSCVQQLKAILRIESIRGTDLISIRCRHTNKVDARDIANEVATAYKDYRAEIELKQVNARLNELRKAIREQEDKVEEHYKVLSILLKSKGSPTANPDASTMTVDQLDIVDAKRAYETEGALLEQLKLKEIGETIIAKIPSESVQIHSPALVAEFPVSPKVTLNLVIGTAAGFFAGILLTLLIAPLLSAKDPRQPRIQH